MSESKDALNAIRGPGIGDPDEILQKRYPVSKGREFDLPTGMSEAAMIGDTWMRGKAASGEKVSAEVENEYKYVVCGEKVRNHLISNRVSTGMGLVQQGYLILEEDRMVRIRRSTYLVGEYGTGCSTSKWRLEMKLGLPGSQSLEFGVNIDPAIYDKLLPHARNVINKDRYFVRDGSGLTYEIDCFWNKGQNYLWLAEIEMDEGMIAPVHPEWFADAILYTVEKGDPRFANQNLASVVVVRRLLREIGLTPY